MSETANAIHRLTERARQTETVPTVTPEDEFVNRLQAANNTTPPADPVYDFEHLGLRIAETLVVAAETQVAEANSLLEQTKALADSIRSQVKIQTEALADLNGRLKTFGSELLDAHRRFKGKHD